MRGDSIEVRKAARRKYIRDRYARRREEEASYRKAWRLKNIGKCLAQERANRLLHRDQILARNRERRRNDPEAASVYKKKYRIANLEKLRKQGRDDAARRRKNKRQECLDYNRKYQQERALNDPFFRIRKSLGSRLRLAVKGFGGKRGSAMKFLGCSVSSFRIYLESLFEPGMSWDNYGLGRGKWNIDHIIPCALFDLTKLEQQERCSHFSNLQPMWSIENARKGCRVIPYHNLNT